jgi:predicted ribosome quality control (RQC) complex YloA/Tae2 family protein
MFWRKREDKLVELLVKVLEQNNETQKNFLETTNRIADAAKQQGEVLAQYLQLFKSPTPPRRWTANEGVEQDMKKELEKAGYPSAGTIEEQAAWLSNNL